MTTLLAPKGGYLAFQTIPKLVRLKKITQILELEGFVMGQYLRGPERTIATVAKLAEEVKEASDQWVEMQFSARPQLHDARVKLLDELADVYHMLDVGAALWHRGDTPMNWDIPRKHSNPRASQGRWATYLQDMRTQPNRSEELFAEMTENLALTKHTFQVFMKTRQPVISEEEVLAVEKAKREKWGPVDGWSVWGMALPETDDTAPVVWNLRNSPAWVEVPFDPRWMDGSLTFDSIYAVTPLG